MKPVWNFYVFALTLVSLWGGCAAEATQSAGSVVLPKSQVAAPKPYGPTPSPQQLRWQKMEFNALICYGIETYTQKEWGFGNDPVSLFKPTNLDTDQWAKVFKEAGIKGAVLVAKHHDGFCLWPSKYNTGYSVKDVAWKNGKGDIVGDLSKSCKKYGLKFGVYLSPWDRNRADYAKPSYVTYYHNQLKELMTNYGDIYEFWIDGANGGTGWYGGANERRTIPKSYYQYDKCRAIIQKHQPNCLIYGGRFPDLRWVGNEAGVANKTHWCRWFNKSYPHGSSEGNVPGSRTTREMGMKDGTHWVPTEADTTLLYPKAWYHKAGRKPRSLRRFFDWYYTSIGRNSLMMIGIQIAPSGQIRPQDVKALTDFAKRMKEEFKTNLTPQATIVASNSRGVGYESSRIADKTTDTYWATSDGVKQASLTLTFKKPTTFNCLVLQEYIQLGQRVHAFTVEALVEGKYQQVASETTIGYKRAFRLPDTTTTAIRITMTTDAPALTLANLGVYKAPPVPGGKAKVMSRKSTSISKRGWKVVGVDSQDAKGCPARHAIDGKANTIWATKWQGKPAKHPHWIAVDLGKVQRIGGFSYLPRTPGNTDGNITTYEFYVSSDAKTWTRVMAGEFGNIKNNPEEQIVRFKKAKTARYIKLVATAAVDGKPFTTIAELGVLSEKK